MNKKIIYNILWMFSGFMTYMTYVHGSYYSTLMDIFRVVWPLVFIGSYYMASKIQEEAVQTEASLGKLYKINEEGEYDKESGDIANIGYVSKKLTSITIPKSWIYPGLYRDFLKSGSYLSDLVVMFSSSRISGKEIKSFGSATLMSTSSDSKKIKAAAEKSQLSALNKRFFFLELNNGDAYVIEDPSELAIDVLAYFMKKPELSKTAVWFRRGALAYGLFILFTALGSRYDGIMLKLLLVWGIYFAWTVYRHDRSIMIENKSSADNEKEYFNIPKDFMRKKFGDLMIFNEVLQKIIQTNDKVVIYFKLNGVKIGEAKLLIQNKLYEIRDITRFQVIDNESLQSYYAAENSVRSALGGHTDLITRITQHKNITAERKLIIAFNDDSVYIVGNIDPVLFDDLHSLISHYQGAKI